MMEIPLQSVMVCPLLKAQWVREASAQIVSGGAMQVRAGAAVDERVRQPALPNSGGDAHPWCTETHP